MGTLSVIELTEDQVKKLRRYEREKRIQAFRIAFERYKETMGEWEMTDYQDAGENWRTESMLKCECGRTLRYQYTVTNRNTAEVLSFGISHLKGHTNFSDNVIREINKQLTIAEKAISEIEERLLENWTFSIEIPEGVIAPDDIKGMLEDGLPLSKSDESRLLKLIQTAQRDKWKEERESYFNEQLNRQLKDDSNRNPKDLAKNGKVKRPDPNTGPFDLWEHEMEFVNEMLFAGVGSAMIISEELHRANQYSERFITGRTKVYPSVVYYLDRLANEGKIVLSQNLGVEDRVYKLLEI